MKKKIFITLGLLVVFIGSEFGAWYLVDHYFFGLHKDFIVSNTSMTNSIINLIYRAFVLFTTFLTPFVLSILYLDIVNPKKLALKKNNK